jgi:hypothetical protein
LGLREHDRVDDTEPNQEHDVSTAHAVADVVEPVEQRGAADPTDRAETCHETVLDEPAEEHCLEEPDDQRHH